jgi:hypothetical protein
MPLTWEPAHRYYRRSAEGYHVSRSEFRGKWRYTAWAPRRGEQVVMLGCHDSAAEAQAECERHSRGD